MPDRRWRNEFLTAAIVWLYGQGHRPDVGIALWRSRILGIAALEGGQLGVVLSVHDPTDLALLQSETRSWTDNDMPGALDLAFEKALPGGDWPIFAFELADSDSEAAAR